MHAFVIGNAALDKTIEVPALPELGASILGREVSQDLGGKGVNQAVVMARAGLGCTLIAPVGRDSRGQEISDRLCRERLDSCLVQQDGVASDASTILQVRGDENAVITTNAAASALSAAEAAAPLEEAQRGDLLVLQGNLSAQTTGAVAQRASVLGLTISLNPSPLRDFFTDLWPLVSTTFVNKGEAAALGGVAALREAGVARVVLTLGSAGAVLIDDAGEARVAPHPAQMLDATGAGDCFMGVALASAALRAVALDSRALRHASVAAALTVTRLGTVSAFPSEQELRAILMTA